MSLRPPAIVADVPVVHCFTTPWGEMTLRNGQARIPAHLSPNAAQIAEWAVAWLAAIEGQRARRNARRRELRAKAKSA